MFKIWLVILLATFSGACLAECVKVKDQDLIGGLLKAAKSIVALRTERELNVLEEALSAHKCGDHYELIFEEQFDMRRFAWRVTFHGDFTKITVYPPQ